ncbi:hypothetical protein SAMN05421642_11329 [Rhodococcoides kyotonense]|uniref:Uncharacterized protein n=1 Tax=Rhodococcoides kyotonense TaxID=398843 RepID=A0A239LHG0_9NOCA|nr:hypothetical protein SAMN05421642_11329 [Rhodococcus kyotonensis]
MTSPEHDDDTEPRPTSFLQMFLDAENRDDAESQ